MLQWDTEADEPYLPVKGKDGYCLTPLRTSDIDGFWQLYREDAISANSIRHRKPFPREDAEKRMQMIMDRTQGVLAEIRAAHASGHLGPDHTFAECPFEVIKDASGKIVGTLNLHTSDVDFKDPLDPPSELEHVNQTWDVGYNVSASQAGKGLATASLRTLIDDWVKPYMKLRRMGAGARATNAASHAVLRKCGYVEIARYERTTAPEIGGQTFGAVKFMLQLD